jgi:hypothetical protein
MDISDRPYEVPPRSGVWTIYIPGRVCSRTSVRVLFSSNTSEAGFHIQINRHGTPHPGRVFFGNTAQGTEVIWGSVTPKP